MKHSNIIIISIIVLFIGISVYLRIVLPYDQIFVGDWVKFSSNDGYYQMRLVDQLLANFPQVPYFDPYFIYPDGHVVGGMIFFNWLLAAIIWVVSLGHPTEHIIDVVSVYYPAILGILTIIPVYFIGKNLFGKVAGLIAAGLVAILPGEFLGRSILGSTDYHVAETLFSTTAMMFLIMALKNVKNKSYIYALLSGLFLGTYLITWQGAPLFVFIITLFVVAQFIVNHIKRVDSMKLVIISTLMYAVAFGMYFMTLIPREFIASCIGILFIPSILYSLSRITKNQNPVFYLAIIGMGIISFTIILRISNPELFASIVSNFSIFNPQGASAQTTLETQPFFELGGQFTTAIAWGNFTTSIIFAPIALIVLAIIYIKNKLDKPEWLLFIVWTLVILMALIAQRRFAYYFIINISLLIGYLGGLFINVCSRKQDKKKYKIIKTDYWGIIVASLIVLGVIFVPNISGAKQTSNPQFSPSNAWMESLEWMEYNTPEPIGKNAYNQMIKPDNLTEKWKYEYPVTAYGVTAWWDYGYWITRIAHRIPSANPSQSPEPIKKVANLFLSQNDDNSRKIMQELKSKYIILDYSSTINKFYAFITWAGLNIDDYMGDYLFKDGNMKVVRLYYASYYESLSVRLYNFDGKEAVLCKPMVIGFKDNGDYREIISAVEAPDYESALRYVSSQKTKNYRIVGMDPFSSFIPLGKVYGFNLVHISDGKINKQPEVKIFECIDK